MGDQINLWSSFAEAIETIVEGFQPRIAQKSTPWWSGDNLPSTN